VVKAFADCPSPCTAGYTCYYVDNVAGSNSNAGTSTSAPWKNLYHVRAQTFSTPTAICLLRGDVWYGGKLEFQGTRAVSATGAVTADGTLSQPFLLDAYGTGMPPTLNAEYAIPSTGITWTCASNICSTNTNASFPEGAPTRIDMVKFGGVWGTCEGANVVAYCPSTGGTAALTANYQFNYTNATGVLAVYDNIGSNPVTDYGGLTPVLDGSTHLLDVDGVNYVAVQHLMLLNQSWYGLEYRGNSGTDHLVVANVYSDTEVPFNYHGTCFYNHPTAASADITYADDECHRGFYGFDFECGALPCTSSNSLSSATLINVKAYFNRSFGLNDVTYTGTAASYSYAHFYGNQIKWPLVQDVNGGTAGASVISNLLDPHVNAYQLYVPRVALNFGDVGANAGADTAFNNYIPALGAAPVSICVATNYPGVSALVTEIQGWVNAGYDISSCGLSDISYQSVPALNVSYAGSGGTAATASITGTFPALTFSTSITGASGQNVSYALTQGGSYSTLQQLEFALRGTNNYAATLPQPCGSCSWVGASALLARDTLPVSGANIFGSPYGFQLACNGTGCEFLVDELGQSKTWISSNLTGTSGKFVYWYPSTFFCNAPTCTYPGLSSNWLLTPETYTVAEGYDAARGAISMQAGSDGVQGGYDVVASAGVDAHGLITCQMAGWNTLNPTALGQTVRVLSEKAAVWGVPWLCYFKSGDLSNPQLMRAVADMIASAVTLTTDSAIATLLESKLNLPASSTSYAWAGDGSAASYNGVETYRSPTVGAGATLPLSSFSAFAFSLTYNLDVFGRTQAQYRAGWDVGATVLLPIYLGLRPNPAPSYAGATTARTTIQPTSPTPNVGNLVGANTCVTPADFGLEICRMTDSTLDPSVPNYTLETSTSGSGDLNLWNTNSTLFNINNEGARLYPMAFNPATMAASRLYPSASGWTATGGFYLAGAGTSWSYSNPMLLYLLNGTVLSSYDFTGYNTGGTPPTATTVYNFTTSANCLGSSYSETWNSYGEGSKYPADQVFVSGFSNAGGQGTGVDVAAYKVGSGCSHLNTQTGAVTGDWGLTGTVGISDRFYVHNVKISKDGRWAMIADATCLSTCTSVLPYFWQIGTLTLTQSCTTGNGCSGHWTEGIAHLINNDNSPFYQEQERLFAQVSPYGSASANPATALLTGLLPSGCTVTQIDQHQNWSNVDPLDTYPFFYSTTATGANAQTPGSYNCAWVNEIDAIAPASGTVYRFAHTFATGLNWNFSGQNAIGSVSQDGRFYMWTSDWLGTLGTEGGANGSCVNTPNGSTACRNDVFVVGLTGP
jgi:hypothetical protein